MKQISSKIQINQLRLYGYHGVSQQEQQVGNWYVIDIDIDAHISDQATICDQLSGTIDHALIVRVVTNEFATPSRLLEHLAHRIAERLFQADSRTQQIHLRIQKIAPPIAAHIGSSSVEFTYVNTTDD